MRYFFIKEMLTYFVNIPSAKASFLLFSNIIFGDTLDKISIDVCIFKFQQIKLVSLIYL